MTAPDAPSGRGLLLVSIDVEPAYEAEFNRWYDEEHFSERMQCPGFLSGRRWVALEGGPRYVAAYELESPEVLTSAAYQAIAPPSEWTAAVTEHFTVNRSVYRDITPRVPQTRVLGQRPAPPTKRPGGGSA